MEVEPIDALEIVKNKSLPKEIVEKPDVRESTGDCPESMNDLPATDDSLAVVKNEEDPHVDADADDGADDDVPTDFFDDFSNKDFLAGLDVVDAWEDDDFATIDSTISATDPPVEGNDSNLESAKEVVAKVEPKTGTDQQEQKAKAGSKPNSNKFGKNQESKFNKKFMIPRRRSRSKSREARKHPAETRRDPDKVKRDIQRDKAKCEKERITTKLQIVETGLVPPGTEMDTPESSSSSANTRHSKDQRDTAKQPTRPSKRMHSRSPSPYQRKRRPSRSHSPIRRSRSPEQRRRYSPVNYRRRSPSPLVHHNRHEERRHRNRTPSPDYRHRRPSKERSTAYVSKQSRDFSVERKQSFLEELDRKLNYSKERDRLQNIQAQLNGGHRPQSANISHSIMINPAHPSHAQLSQQHAAMIVNPSMVPPPQMVPPPNLQQSYNPMVYDQQFFVGNAMPDINPYSSNMYQNPHQPSATYDPFHQDAHFYAQQQVAQQQAQSDHNFEAMQKLFGDDNISLTEYLRIAHRSTDHSQQINLNHKVKVLNRSQDAMKLMSELARPNGRFYYNNRKRQQNKTEKPPVEAKATSSPMKIVAPVRFQFTSKARPSEDKMQPTSINRLLTKLGIKESVHVGKASPAEAKPTSREYATQTDTYECNDCQARSMKEYVDVGVQCEPETAVFSGQVTEDDFLSTARSALKNILKNQSFSSLTPAQILAQLEGTEPTEKARAGAAAVGRLQMERELERHSDYDRRTVDYERRQLQPDHDFDRRTISDYDRRSDWMHPRNPAHPAPDYLSSRIPNHMRPPLQPHGFPPNSQRPMGPPNLLGYRGNQRLGFLDPPGFINYGGNGNKPMGSYMNNPRPGDPRDYSAHRF